jgi:hypothetical protein
MEGHPSCRSSPQVISRLGKFPPSKLNDEGSRGKKKKKWKKKMIKKFIYTILLRNVKSEWVCIRSDGEDVSENPTSFSPSLLWTFCNPARWWGTTQLAFFPVHISRVFSPRLSIHYIRRLHIYSLSGRALLWSFPLYQKMGMEWQIPPFFFFYPPAQCSVVYPTPSK